MLGRHCLPSGTCRRHFSSLPRTVLSGIQPTGTPHLGNYLGALKNWVTLQNTANDGDRVLFSVVGWHALTLPQDPLLLRKSRREMLAALLAVGIDTKKSILFRQEDNPDHTDLAWILSCLTPMGKLRRMTTWKSRLLEAQPKTHLTKDGKEASEEDVDETSLHAGLFTYPVLQAADILVYRATHVPVGDDQSQHIELCADLADLFNRTFKRALPEGRLFPIPRIIKTPTPRILSLRDPRSKMSKSAPNVSSRILLTDSFQEIHAKIRAAVTDSLTHISYDPIARPGTSNLLGILAACSATDVEFVVAQYANTSKTHSDLKKDVAEAIEDALAKPRAEFARLTTGSEDGYLDEVARQGALKAREISGPVLEKVRKVIGLA